MQSVKLTLELTFSDALAVLTLLQKTADPSTAVIDSHAMGQAPTKTTVTPTAGKKTKMPGFGRTQANIDQFTEHEQERFEKKTEDELLKEQRAEERKIAKAEKQAKINEQKAKDKREQDEIDDIKALNLASTTATETVTKAPWAL